MKLSGAYNRGFYTVDVRFFYRISVEASTTVGCPRLLNGLAVFDKRCILFGSDGGARIFSSQFVQNGPDQQNIQSTNKPTAVVECVDPILLDAKVVEPHYCCGGGCDINSVPPSICRHFGGDDISLCNDGNRLFVTLGQFSILRLERDIQLLMPAYDICLPERDCDCTGAGEAVDPCDVFERFEFPLDDFFPPRKEKHSEPCNPCGNLNSGCGTGSGGNSSGCHNSGCGSRCKCK